ALPSCHGSGSAGRPAYASEWRSGYNRDKYRPEGSPVDFSFTEEQLMLQDVARRIAQEVIAPSAEHFDRTGEFPLENIRLLGENGLQGTDSPPAHCAAAVGAN